MYRSIGLAAAAAGVVLGCGLWTSPARAAAVSLTPQGQLSGSTVSAGRAVSNNAAVTVGVASPAPVGNQAFRWSPGGGGMVALGGSPGGFTSGEARGISGNGLVAVGFGNSASGTEAFRWTAAGGTVGLGDLTGGSFSSAALDTNSDGSVVVGYGFSASGQEASRWTPGLGMVGLGDLAGGTFNSAAAGITPDGSVIVGFGDAGDSPTRVNAFRWTSGGGMVPLGHMPGGDQGNQAEKSSDDGSVVVGTWYSAVGGSAMKWTAAGGMVDLGDVPGGPLDCTAFDVSGNGSIIVGRGSDAAGFEGVLWTSNDGMIKLWDLLQAQGVNPALDGWSRLAEVRAITADGTTVVGNGIRNGNTESFIAVIPEPASLLSLLAVGGLALLRRRNRRSLLNDPR